MKNHNDYTQPVMISPPRFTVRSVAAALAEIQDWGLQMLGVHDIWSVTQGEDIKICLLDTGVDHTHPDLEGAIREAVDFTGSRVRAFDTNGHGTHCCGIIGARQNSAGIIGVAPKAELMMAKVLGDEGTGGIENLIDGIDWAIDKKADVISMSLGTVADNDDLHNAILRAYDAGIILVAAAGNDSSLDHINYPARYEECIAVGSINKYKLHSAFSSGSSELDIVAPGEEVYSTYKGGIYAKLSGTSMATPFVAGICALILAKHKKYASTTPIRNCHDMRAHLIRNAIDLGKKGFDTSYGFGLINPGKSVFTASEEMSVHNTQTTVEKSTTGLFERTYLHLRQEGIGHNEAIRQTEVICNMVMNDKLDVRYNGAMKDYILGDKGCIERIRTAEIHNGIQHHQAANHAGEVWSAVRRLVPSH